MLTIAESWKLINCLRQVIKEDGHNGRQGYQIRSLYFDTLNDSDYEEKIEGVEKRRKIRLRRYLPETDNVMLEEKKKSDVYQRKRSLQMKQEDAEQLIKGNYSVLLNYQDEFAAECFYLMSDRCYRPKAVVEYQRRAYIAKENNIRITLDSNIIVTESCFNLFSKDLLQYPVMESSYAVLEVKYNGFLPSYIKELLKLANHSEISFSKYCLSRSSGLHYQI